MNKPLALLWGFLTLVPFAALIYVFGLVDMPESGPDYEKTKEAWDRSFEIHKYNMLLMMGLMASYIVYLFKTEHVPKDKKALWAVVLFLGHLISMPFFWFFYVWQPLKRNDNQSAT